MKKKITSLLLVLVMALTLLPGTAWAADTSGKCGDNVTWSYSNGTLTIQGTGDMVDFDYKSQPWYDFREQIYTVRIGNGVTSIGKSAFYECSNLISLTISDSITTIGENAFWRCNGLTSVTIPDSVTIIGDFTFHECRSLTSVTIPNSVTSIGAGAFQSCNSLLSVIIPNSVTAIGGGTFTGCRRLTRVTIPDKVTSIGIWAFDNCDSLTDVYYSGNEGQWNQISVEDYNDELLNATIHYNSTRLDQGASFPSTPASSAGADEYIYDVSDPGESVQLPTEVLDNVTDPSSAAAAVKQMTDGMTAEQKSSATGVDLTTLYAETAVSRAASKSADSGDIVVSASEVASLASEAAQAVSAVETALSSGGVTTARYLSKTVTFTTNDTAVSIQVSPDILTAQVDNIRVETPSYALTLRVADLKDDLTAPLTFKAQELTSNYALKNNSEKATVKIDLPKAQMTNPVIVSLPKSGSDITFQAVVKSDGSATSSKFNPATLTMDGRINTSGTYTVKTNEKSFTDISNKSAEMQRAILYLSSKGIISGTSDTQFSPDNSINRQQIAALIMRALGKVDNTATTNFTDVPPSSSLYHAIASSQRHGIINGYSDNTFRGANVISKNQIVTVSGRVLTSEMNYKAPSNTSTYLGKYSDSVPEYAQEMVALATREGLVVYRTDGTFSGDKNMTRGDAAIILYRLFQRIW